MIFERIHALPGTSACRTSATIQAVEIAAQTKRQTARDAADRARNVAASFRAGEASADDVDAAEAEARATAKAAGDAARELAAKRVEHGKKHLAALAPVAAEIGGLTTELANLADALRIRADAIDAWSQVHGMPVPRTIAHAARLGRVVRQLRDLTFA
jgi:hypothetical protein